MLNLRDEKPEPIGDFLDEESPPIAVTNQRTDRQPGVERFGSVTVKNFRDP